MQHQSLVGSYLDSCACKTSSSHNVSSCPIVSASATCLSTSFLACDFKHSLHFPTTFLHQLTNSSQTDSHSCKTAFIPLGWPWSSRSGWSAGYTISWGWPRVSGWPGFGGGLLMGITVGCKCHCLPLGLIFILLMLSASSAMPSCAEEQLKSQIPTLSGCRYSNILMACCIWSISCLRSHQASWFFPG